MAHDGGEAIAELEPEERIAPSELKAGDEAPREDGQRPYQRTLPLPWQMVRPIRESDFAHPAELDFSRILTYYRVRWVYEPTTFALAWKADGQPAEMFTPDFYLPDHGLYIELTTMRQRLVTRKNRKLRRMRELYPTVRVKLLYRRDYHRLVVSYSARARDGSCRVGRVLFGEDQIRERIDALATRFAATDDKGPVLMLTVGAGGAVFGAAMTAALAARGVAVETDRVRLTRFRTTAGCHVRISRRPLTPVAGRRVLVVTDVISTGLSLAYLTSWLARQGAREIQICTLLDRREARLIDLPVELVGFEAPNEILVGFGLHLRRQFRDLPYIATIEVE